VQNSGPRILVPRRPLRFRIFFWGGVAGEMGNASACWALDEPLQSRSGWTCGGQGHREMEPVPATIVKTYPPRGPMQQFRFSEGTAFRCFRCGDLTKTKLIAIYSGDWARRLCNGCYGRLLSLYEIKAGTAPDDERADALASVLLSIVAIDNQRKAELLFRASEKRANILSPETLRFVATAEHVAGQLGADPQLEWSPAVIGLCKAAEVEVVGRILRPLSVRTSHEDLDADKSDKDIGRIAAFCADSTRRPPELGTFAHFLQTVIHSQQRRQSSPLITSFLGLAAEWTGSYWLLDPNGLHQALGELTSKFRNRAAHIDELGKQDYVNCRELVIGAKGVLWNLVVSTERHKDVSEKYKGLQK
jgi:hypothetical protein